MNVFNQVKEKHMLITMGLPGPSKPAIFEPEEWPIVIDLPSEPEVAPEEVPVEAPVEEPVEAPVEEPVEAPEETPVEEPAEVPEEAPVEEPVPA